LKKIQERALRFAYQDYEASYENFILIKEKMPTQHIRRIRTMAMETFTILNGLAPPVLSNKIIMQSKKIKSRTLKVLVYRPVTNN
jgi:hypothetical protein